MAPTPIVATHRVRFNLTIQSQARRFDQYVDATPNGASAIGWDFVHNASVSSNPHAEDAIDKLWSIWAPVWASGHASFGPADLEHYDVSTGSYVPVATWNTAVVPTGGGAFRPGKQAIFQFYDLTRLKVRFQVPEPDDADFARFISRATMGPVGQALYDSVLSPTTPQDVGGWVRGRAGQPLLTFISEVVGPNRKYRRLRGIA